MLLARSSTKKEGHCINNIVHSHSAGLRLLLFCLGRLIAQHNCGSYNHSYICPRKIPAIPLTLILEAGSTCLGRRLHWSIEFPELALSITLGPWAAVWPQHYGGWCRSILQKMFQVLALTLAKLIQIYLKLPDKITMDQKLTEASKSNDLSVISCWD